MQMLIHGSRFLVCDAHGDVSHLDHGLFAHDTRMLSRWVLRIDGHKPQQLGEEALGRLERRIVQRAAATDRVASDALLVSRSLVLDNRALRERILLQNLGDDAISLPVTVEAGADFDDLFAVKDAAFSRTGDLTGDVGIDGNSRRALQQPLVVAGDAATFHGPFQEQCTITATMPWAHVDDNTLTWQVDLGQGESWCCDLEVTWRGDSVDRGDAIHDGFDGATRRVRKLVTDWRDRMPVLHGGSEDLRRAWATSLHDLGALRLHDTGRDDDMLVAAGAPWFMTVFGRDSAIACMQTMILGPNRARGVLEHLATFQAATDDASRDAEPGKILHEQREGAIARRGYDRYYGSLDSTPLFLMLLGEYHAWTGDDDCVRALWENARRALDWIIHHGDRDGDGLLEFLRRAPAGVEIQSWKDSHDSQRHADGSTAVPPIAPVEVQGYAYAAFVACARLARDVIGDTQLATDLDGRAAAMLERIRTRFWIPQLDSFALGLDCDKRPMAVRTSNPGHLLWSGAIEDPDQRKATVRNLGARDMCSGWGVRTMSTREVAFNPLSYHCGTVWPHDTAIAGAGLARAGDVQTAAVLFADLVAAAAQFDGRLPEVFAGLDRDDVPFPVRYPTASSPQAWAAGAIPHLLVELLGLRPDTAARRLASDRTGLPEWFDGIELDGVVAFGCQWNARVSGGAVSVQPAQPGG